jgi:hypothetical protein
MRPLIGPYWGDLPGLPRFRRQTQKVKLSSGAATECRILSVIGPTNTLTGLLDSLSAHRFDGHTPINDVNRSGNAGQGVQRACPSTSHEIVPERRGPGRGRQGREANWTYCNARQTTSFVKRQTASMTAPPLRQFAASFDHLVGTGE